MPSGARAKRLARQAEQARRAAEFKQEQEAAEREEAARAKTERRAHELAVKRAREEEEARKAAQLAAQAESQRQAEFRDKQLAERLVARESEDTALGYKHVTVEDFLLDYRETPRGSKVVLEGYHYALGRMETISDSPQSTQPVYLDTTGLSREARKSLLECHSHSFPYCGITVWAHTGCVMTAFGQTTEAPCLIVDGVMGGHYVNVGATHMMH